MKDLVKKQETAVCQPKNKKEIPTYAQKLPKGKYDIQYVIDLCCIVEENCEKLMLDRSNGMLTIRESMKSLRKYLEVERMQNHPDHIFLKTCQICSFSEVIRLDYEMFWKCPDCSKQKRIEVKDGRS